MGEQESGHKTGFATGLGLIEQETSLVVGLHRAVFQRTASVHHQPR